MTHIQSQCPIDCSAMGYINNSLCFHNKLSLLQSYVSVVYSVVLFPSEVEFVHLLYRYLVVCTQHWDIVHLRHVNKCELVNY